MFTHVHTYDIMFEMCWAMTRPRAITRRDLSHVGRAPRRRPVPGQELTAHKQYLNTCIY